MAALVSRTSTLSCIFKNVFLQNSCRSLVTAELKPRCQFSTSPQCFQEDGEHAENKEKPKRLVVDVDTSMRYMLSKAYNTTYGDEAVWVKYRRNHKGPIPPRKTRKTCIRGGQISTGNPCPICRDEYLVLDPKNVKLLKQFISPETGQVISYSKTNICQMQHKKLLISVQQAWDGGNIDMPIPFRKYDYSQYYPHLRNRNKESYNELKED